MAERIPFKRPRSRSIQNNNHPTTDTAATLSSDSASRSQLPTSLPSNAWLGANAPRSSSQQRQAATATPSSLPLTPVSSRVTRASARHAANESEPTPSTATTVVETANTSNQLGSSTVLATSTTNHTTRKSTRKRKAVETIGAATHTQDSLAQAISTPRRSKRAKIANSTPSPSPTTLSLPPAASTRSRKGNIGAVMSGQESASDAAGTVDGSTPASGRPRRGRKVVQEDMVGSTASSPSSQHQTFEDRLDVDTAMAGTDEGEMEPSLPPPPHSEVEQDDDDGEGHDEDRLHHYSEDGLSSPFGGGFAAPPRGSGLPAALSMLGGMLSMSGMGSRLRDILTSLRQKDDPSVQLIALQDLSEILLVSNEDNLSGSFSPDSYVRELVVLMQPNEITGEENPEVMLLACRCLANLMEALPASVANVVYGGAVPVLCQKLLEISFIDLAEQALSTLEKISVEYPASIVREGGLTACLSYLEFFATSTQRTAVTTAANCCRNIPVDSFPVVHDVMPILLSVLNSNDQRVVEQAALCVSRIVESFKHYPSKLEELVGVDMLRAILNLLLPGSANHLISPNLHTQFLRVLAITASDSPRLATELFKMNVVETLYQILTGVSPPSDTEDLAAKLDNVIIMQALIHRPREQIIEALNVICNLLPREADMIAAGSATDGTPTSSETVGGAATSLTATNSDNAAACNDKRIDLLNECKDEVRRFALILFPTLMNAYSSTVNLDVRSRVLLAQIKMLSNLDRDIILEALKAVPYASFLASILSQQDHPLLVKNALQATEFLMSRLDDIYRYQLYREGVISEIEKIAVAIELEPQPELEPEAHLESDDEPMGTESPAVEDADITQSSPIDEDEDSASENGNDENVDEGRYNEAAENRAGLDIHVGNADDDDAGELQHSSDEDEDNDHDVEDRHDGVPRSPVSSEDSTTSAGSPPRRLVTAGPSQAYIAALAKKFLKTHEAEKNEKAMRKKATHILSSLRALTEEISAFYLERTPASLPLDHGVGLFKRLAAFFDPDVFQSATSTELLASGLVHVLERVFSNSDGEVANAAHSAFLEVFMGNIAKSHPSAVPPGSSATPFSVLIHKLQDLLSRSEHFEVITVHHNTFDSNHSSATSMLAKQIRLRLVADDDSGIPRAFRSIMVSIHAISTFKALEDYLRPRINLSDHPRGTKRDGLSRVLAAMAGSAAGPLGASAATRLAERSAQLFSGSSLLSPHTPHAVSGASRTSTSNHSQAPTQVSLTPSLGPRSTRRSNNLKTSEQSSNPTGGGDPSRPDEDGIPEEKAVLRRSSRRPPPTSTDPPPTRAPEDSNSLADALVCADEKQTPDNDTSLSDNNTMDAIVGDAEEDMSPMVTPDSSAVSLEVAAGGKITARKEDGTRVPTPSQKSPSLGGANRTSTLTAALQIAPATPSSSTPRRPISYSAAMQATPQDWHMVFTLNGKVVPIDSTVYRAVLNSSLGRDELLGRSVWSAIHSVHYRRVPGPQPTEHSGFGCAASHADSVVSDNGQAQTPLDKNTITASILRLLKVLHDLNANVDDVLVESKETLKLNVEPLSQFVNTKLTAKLNRQLEEPLIVASNCLPNWSEDLARIYPFLFPFETRHLFLQSTSFGYARSMARWQNSQVQDESRRDRRDERPFLGRLQRQKVRISRSKILESAVKVMELYGASQSILEVEYFEEVGTGLGPTLEFYSTVSREFAKKKLKLWRDNELNDSEFVSSSTGVFPRPMSDEDCAGTNGERILSLFRALGKFVARSMLDSRIIDINFNPIFFRIGDETSGVRPSLGAVKVVDPALARSLLLIKKFAIARKEIDEDPHRTAAEKVADIEAITVNNTHIDDLSLDFTLPGHPEIELIPSGAQIGVTIDNVDVYIEKVVAMTLGSGVRRQVDAFRKGFSQVFPYSALSAFTPNELVSLFGRVEEDWSLETLMDSVKADHGFNMDSRSVKNLLQVMSELTPSARRDFLQFTTGSPKLPIGGFRSLTPMFTVVCKPSEAPYTSDDYLPSVMTCVNYLKLPDYSSIDVLRKQLFMAIKEGQGAFHLS